VCVEHLLSCQINKRLVISFICSFSVSCNDIDGCYLGLQGLLPAIDSLLPGVDQRFCMRHLYNNFRKRFPRKQLKELVWKATNSIYPRQWESIMREIRTINEEAYKYMFKIAPRH